MIPIWIDLLVMAGAFISAHVVSLYSLAVYLDPDDVDSFVPHLSRRRRRFILKLAADPRALVQIATIYKSFSLVLVTVMGMLMMVQIAHLGEIAAGYFYPAGFLVIWGLYILFVEYLPRAASRHAIDRAVPRYLWMVTTIYVLFLPILSLYRNALKRQKPEDQPTEDEKEEIVERAIETLAEEAGIAETLVEEDEKKMIGQIFQLDQTVVREIMVPRIDMCGIDKTLSFREIQALVKGDRYSRFPVYEDTIDHVLGILYVKDLFNDLPQPGEVFQIERYLRKPYFIPESKVIGDLLREFKQTKTHIAIVIDEYGGVSGMVTLEDILEEIVGEIQDEHDTEEAPIVEMADGRYMVDAGISLELLQESLGTDYETGDYDTVGGLLYHLAGTVPKQGTVIAWHDVDFEVVRTDGQRIKKVRVSPRRSTKTG
ncbi:MAG: hemolysin family protein [Candidatus Zixiibacteriota bacterium]